MSHYGDYIKEREGYDIIEDEKGYATFIINGDECYIRDVHVNKDFRRQGVGKQYMKTIESFAKTRGVKFLLGSAWIRAKGVSESIIFMFDYGFYIHHLDGEGIYFRKEIK